MASTFRSLGDLKRRQSGQKSYQEGGREGGDLPEDPEPEVEEDEDEVSDEP